MRVYNFNFHFQLLLSLPCWSFYFPCAKAIHSTNSINQRIVVVKSTINVEWNDGCSKSFSRWVRMNKGYLFISRMISIRLICEIIVFVICLGYIQFYMGRLICSFCRGPSTERQIIHDLSTKRALKQYNIICIMLLVESTRKRSTTASFSDCPRPFTEIFRFIINTC